MLKTSKRKLPVVGVLLAIVCAIGVILTAQRYFLLQAVEDALKTQKALDESFMVAINAGVVGPNTSPSEFAKTVAAHLEQTADVRRAVSELSASIETSEILSATLWTVVLLALGFSAVRRGEAPGPSL